MGTGNKYLSETDYQQAGFGGLRWQRFYNNQNTAVVSTLGTAWRHAYDSSITGNLTIKGVSAVLVARTGGSAYAFSVNGSSYTSQDPDVTDKLIGLTDATGKQAGWQYVVTTDDSIETYNVTGKLITIRDRSGLVQTLMYSDNNTVPTIAPGPGLLLRISDAFGRQLNK